MFHSFACRVVLSFEFSIHENSLTIYGCEQPLRCYTLFELFAYGNRYIHKQSMHKNHYRQRGLASLIGSWSSHRSNVIFINKSVVIHFAIRLIHLTHLAGQCNVPIHALNLSMSSVPIHALNLSMFSVPIHALNLSMSTVPIHALT